MRQQESSGLIELARKVIRIEAEAVSKLAERIGTNFVKAVELIFSCQGRVIVSGIGKSGLIGEKIAATLRSTGTPAIFLHPAEAIHGDLGIIKREDLILCLSYSGETEEILLIIPYIKRMGGKIISLTGKVDSTLARHSDVVLDVRVQEEACPLGLAPTASTTASLAMGDALAVALIEKKGFKERDFAFLHPGGSLGRRLLLKVSDLMHTGDEIPRVYLHNKMEDMLLTITSKRLGTAVIVDEKDHLLGIFTDGDLRRLIEKNRNIFDLKISEVMTKNPKHISPESLADAAIQMMESNEITCLPVVNEKKVVIGIVHLHDLLKAKLY